MKGMNRAPAKEAPHYAANRVGSAAFTVGVSSAHVVNVAVQLGDANLTPNAEIGSVEVYLSDDADGHTLTATATDAFAIGTKGVVVGTLTSGKMLKVISGTDGIFDLNVQCNAGHDYYLVVCLLDGSIVVSPIVHVT